MCDNEKERACLHNRERASQEQVGNLHLGAVNSPEDFGSTHSPSDTSEPLVNESHDAVARLESISEVRGGSGTHLQASAHSGLTITAVSVDV